MTASSGYAMMAKVSAARARADEARLLAWRDRVAAGADEVIAFIEVIASDLGPPSLRGKGIGRARGQRLLSAFKERVSPLAVAEARRELQIGAPAVARNLVKIAKGDGKAAVAAAKVALVGAGVVQTGPRVQFNQQNIGGTQNFGDFLKTLPASPSAASDA